MPRPVAGDFYFQTDDLMKSNNSKKKIRILHLLTHLKKGGAESNTFLAMEALQDQDYEVHLGFGDSFEESERYRALKMGITTQKFSGLRNELNLLSEFKALKNIYQYLVSKKIDVIHTHQTKAGVLGRIAAGLASTPLVIYGIHGSTVSAHGQPLKSLLYFFEYITKFTTDHFVSVGEELREEFVDNHFCSYENSTVIHSPIRLKEFYRAGQKKRRLKEKCSALFDLDPRNKIIGTVGRLNPSKGYKYIIEVASRIVKKYENVTFLFVGGGNEDYKKKLRKLVIKKNLSQSIIFTGYQENIAELMGAFDVFLFASLREGLPQVLVQAATCALPIVTFNVNGAKEVVEDGETGYIVPKGDIDELSQKLESLIENPLEATQMGSKGQKAIDENKWRPEKIKLETVELYDKLTKQCGIKG